jgi:hypothetical protein
MLPLPLPLDLATITINLKLPNLPTLPTLPTLNPTALLSRLSLLVHRFQQQDEDQLLNGIWIGLLSVEALMVLGVMVRGLVGAVASRGYGKGDRRRRRSSGDNMAMGMGHGMSMSEVQKGGEDLEGEYYWRE